MVFFNFRTPERPEKEGKKMLTRSMCTDLINGGSYGAVLQNLSCLKTYLANKVINSKFSVKRAKKPQKLM